LIGPILLPQRDGRYVQDLKTIHRNNADLRLLTIPSL